MKQFYIFILTIMLFSLWFLPPYLIIVHNASGGWGALYIPIIGLTILFGVLVRVHFHYIFDK